MSDRVWFLCYRAGLVSNAPVWQFCFRVTELTLRCTCLTGFGFCDTGLTLRCTCMTGFGFCVTRGITRQCRSITICITWFSWKTNENAACQQRFKWIRQLQTWGRFVDQPTAASQLVFAAWTVSGRGGNRTGENTFPPGTYIYNRDVHWHNYNTWRWEKLALTFLSFGFYDINVCDYCDYVQFIQLLGLLLGCIISSSFMFSVGNTLVFSQSGLGLDVKVIFPPRFLYLTKLCDISTVWFQLLSLVMGYSFRLFSVE